MFLSSTLRAQFDAVPEDWRSLLGSYLHSAACEKLCRYIDQACAEGKRIYPEQIFQALHLTSVAEVAVIILGQDPYHGIDRLTGQAQAHGLAFSVPLGVRCPPSLVNIFRELQQDMKVAMPTHGHLRTWAQQGVLLLNTSLTVEAACPASHAQLCAGEGWEKCTDELLTGLAAYHAQRQRRLIVMLWGNHAQAKASLFAEHHVLQAPHPSPLSAYRGFFGCQHFSQANQLLSAAGQAPIDWSLPEIGVMV